MYSRGWHGPANCRSHYVQLSLVSPMGCDVSDRSSRWRVRCIEIDGLRPRFKLVVVSAHAALQTRDDKPSDLWQDRFPFPSFNSSKWSRSSPHQSLFLFRQCSRAIGSRADSRLLAEDSPGDFWSTIFCEAPVNLVRCFLECCGRFSFISERCYFFQSTCFIFHSDGDKNLYHHVLPTWNGGCLVQSRI